MRSRWIEMAMVAFVAVVAFGVFGPSPQFDRLAGAAERVEDQVRPAVPSVVRHGPLTEAVSGQIERLDVQDVSNILMFVPFGVLFPACWPRRRWWTVPTGVLLSATIEVTQLVFLSWRSPQLADILLNSLGAALGFAIWLAGQAIAHAIAGTSERAPTGDRATITRSGG